MAIQGCRTGTHLFVGAKKEDKEELVDCRVDHYQTPRQVIVSAFGKGADKEKSVVKFEEEAVRLFLECCIFPGSRCSIYPPTQMHIDLILPAKKRYTKSFALYGPIDPATSTFKVLGTKVEIVLAKADARSWPSITALDPSLSKNFVAQLAFSAGGGRGTIGSKDMVLDDQNKLR